MCLFLLKNMFIFVTFLTKILQKHPRRKNQTLVVSTLRPEPETLLQFRAETINRGTENELATILVID